MKNISKPGLKFAIFAAVLIGLTACVALADPFAQYLYVKVESGGSGSGCPGPYVGYTKMTNSSGGIWITPPTGTTSGTLTDISGFPPPYSSSACVARKSDLATWCDTGSVTFPATHSDSYQLLVFVNSSPAPTNALILQINWQ